MPQRLLFLGGTYSIHAELRQSNRLLQYRVSKSHVWESYFSMLAASTADCQQVNFLSLHHEHLAQLAYVEACSAQG